MEADMSKKERQNRISVISAENISSTMVETVIDEVMRVEKEAWPEEVQATRDKFESRLNIFPKGFLLAEVQGFGIMGVSTSEIINFDSDKPPPSWEEITDNGYIRSTHKKDGDALYVVSVGVSRRVEQLGIKGVGTALVNAQQYLASTLGLNYVVLGARISGYGKYFESHPETRVEDYLELKREDGETLDPEIRFYERNGFKISKIVPNYMEDDPESRNYGAVMVWENGAKTNGK